MPVVVNAPAEETKGDKAVTLADIGARLKITRSIDIASLPLRARAAVVGRILQYACDSIPYRKPADPLQTVRKPVTALQESLISFGEGDARITVNTLQGLLAGIEGRSRIAQAARHAVQVVVEGQTARSVVPEILTDVVATLLEEKVPTEMVREALRAIEQFYASTCGDVRAAGGADIPISQKVVDPLNVMRGETERRAFRERETGFVRFADWTGAPPSEELAD